MSESKQTDAEEFLRSRAAVEVTAVEVSPNPAALTDELNLEVDFTLDRPVLRGVWDIEVSAAWHAVPKSIFAGCARWRADRMAAPSIFCFPWWPAVSRRLGDQAPCDQYPPTAVFALLLSPVLAACCDFQPTCSLNLVGLPTDGASLHLPRYLHSSDRSAPQTTRAATTTSSSRCVQPFVSSASGS
jgi:hypothetical protein